MARVYVTEGKGLKPLMKYLHDESKVRGVTVFRGITGFGKSGTMHSSSLLDMSLDLPLVIEFFDTPSKAATALRHLSAMVDPGHIVTWSAEINEE